MRICKIDISNFRGVKSASIFMDGNAVFVGDNNSGKSTIFEAIDLVMGPERLMRHPVINEHDFYVGEYIKNGAIVEICIEVTVIDLSDEQQIHFGNHIEWWNKEDKLLIEGPPATDIDDEHVVPALRLKFIGSYDPEEDDFIGHTYFAETLREGCQPELFGSKDKRKCGFLYLRTLRTGNRALSFERGSLLDIILQLKEMKPQMWEKIISQLKSVSVAGDPELGIEDILISVQNSLSTIVSHEAGNNPQIKVSNMTREHLRKILTVFMGTGAYCEDGSEYTIPYYHQGTGTINILVLTLLSMIADIKENVIFAMEEPEIAIPPHIQKRVIISVVNKSTQALFTSHSPYVLEEFSPCSILVLSRNNGELKATPAGMPPGVKKKEYKDEFRRRFCESLLARRVLITEGRTEYDVYSTTARKLQELNPDKNYSFELLGISLVNAQTDSQIAQLGEYYQNLHKTVYAVFDKQESAERVNIDLNTDFAYEAEEHGIEEVVLKNVEYPVLLRYALSLTQNNAWPQHLSPKKPFDGMDSDLLHDALLDYFRWSKGSGTLADLIETCDEHEMPLFIVETIKNISNTIIPPQTTEVDDSVADKVSDVDDEI